MVEQKAARDRRRRERVEHAYGWNYNNMSTTYEITTDPDSIVIKLPRHATDRESLEKLLDYLEIESLRRHSKMTEEEANQLAEEVKQGAWQQVKHLFEEE